MKKTKKKKEENSKSSKTLIFAIIAIFLLIGLIYSFSSIFNLTGSVIEEPLDTSYEPEEIPVPTEPLDESLDFKVEILNFAYSPMELEINVGDRVIWENRDSYEHTVTSLEGYELNSVLLREGDRFSHTFNDVGVYEYYCKPHPYMRGVVIVNE